MNDSDIRNQIIIEDNNCVNDNLSNLELLAKYSKNKKNLKLFKKLLLKDINISQINKLLNDTITYVDSTASIDVIKFLIKSGADINFQDSFFGWTALMNCSLRYMNSIETINFLINNGADANIKSKFDKTALIYFMEKASDKDVFEIIKLLIRKSSQIYYKNKNGYSILMNCFNIICQDKLVMYNMIKLLLDNKLDIYVRNYSNKNILNIVEQTFGKNSDIYSLIFNFKNIIGDHFCEYDIYFIY